MSRVVEDIAGRGVDGNGARVGRWIGRGTGVKLEGLKAMDGRRLFLFFGGTIRLGHSVGFARMKTSKKNHR